MHIDQKTLARFWAKVDKNSGFIPQHCSGECWEWTGSLNNRGYGRFALRHGELVGAHRFAFELECGPLGDLQCCHRCDNRRCVRPSHLFKGTHLQNLRDAAWKGHFRGERNGSAKLTSEEVERIRELYSTGAFTQEVLGKRFGVHRTCVNMIINRRRWNHSMEETCPDLRKQNDAEPTSASMN